MNGQVSPGPGGPGRWRSGDARCGSAGGATAALSIVENATGIATGRGSRAQYVVDDAGQLWLRQGAAGWEPVVPGVRDPVFPG